MKRILVLMFAVTLAAASGIIGAVHSQDQNAEAVQSKGERIDKVIYPTRENTDQSVNQAAHPQTSAPVPKASNGITYHGGPLIGTVGQPPVYIYYIWYGNWSGNSATTILTDLGNSIGGSPYYNINTTYYNASNSHIVNSITYGGSTTDNYSQGTSLSDSAIRAVVSSAITSGRLPKNANALYFVLTSQDVTASSGFCTQYCGWHTHSTISGSDIKYSFVGNAARCISSCAAQSVGPNGNAGADGMASILAHELEETNTDPDLNAWYDSRGAENADKCAWTFGSTTTLPSGAKYNMTLGSRKYLIQQNWVNASGGFCAKSF
ncbi:MAG: hypothetical protein JWM21_2286 [Acidobacteria bacterium]|nr:hypothetical protein [Acidobacteriota bacterium]